MVELLEGCAGVRLPLGAEWTLDRSSDAGAPREETWRGPAGLTLRAGLSAHPVLVDPFLLDDHRQDLRLIAAARGGGLIACEPALEGRAVQGLIKLPRAVGRLEVRVEAHLLVPLEEGHLWLVLAAEEDRPGERETAVLRALAPAGAPDDWVGDAYGRPYQRQARDLEFTRHTSPAELLLRTRADDVEHDARFPDHPLTRVRGALSALLADLMLLAPCGIEIEPEVSTGHGVQLGLPLGFLAEEPLARGRVYRRRSFEARVSALRVELLPGGAGLIADEAAARAALVERWGASGAEVVQGPRLRGRTVGRYRGIYAELDARDGQDTCYGAVFLVPWRDGDALLLSVAGARDDWGRANRDLEAVVCCLSPFEDPSPDDSGEDTAKFVHVSLNGLRRIYRVLCRLAHCDGHVDPRERKALETFCRRHRIAPAEAEALEVEAAESERLRVGRKPAERELLIETMLHVVAADGVLDPAEQSRLARIARAVELPEAQLAARVAERMRG